MNLKIIPLGGVEEIGINCTIFEYNRQMVIVDMGLGFPNNDNMYGIDFLVPNDDYLIKNKERIEGIVITHGHLDHIGALPYLLPRIGFPEVYGTEFTIELIKNKLDELGLLPQAKLRVIKSDSVLASGDFKLSFFRVNHSIPQCVGVVIDTPAARVVHTGDFKFDNSPVNEPVADYARLAQLGEEGVDVLLSDSTNSLRKGHPISESDVSDSLEAIIEKAQGRVFIAAFGGLVGRLYQLIKLAEKHERKVAIAGYSMQQALKIAEKIGYIRPKPGVIVPIHHINRYNKKRIMILTTGSQGESNAALSRMANGDYKQVRLTKGDTVVLSSGVIPGNNSAVQRLMDAITLTGAHTHQSENLDFFTSGHGYQEDQKIMLNLIKPKTFIPVHGYQYFLHAHAETARQVGLSESQIMIPKRGGIIEGNKSEGFHSSGKVKNFPLLVSGSGVGDIGSQVLSERQQLGNNGVIVISVLLDKQNKKIITGPLVITRGFIYVKTSRDLFKEIETIVSDQLRAALKKGLDAASIRQGLDKEIGKFVQAEIGREPLILSAIHFN